MALRSVDNPPNPWHGAHVEWIDAPQPAQLKVYEEDAKSLITEHDSPDIGFRFGANPYRGCQHACAYCYARPTHEYLDFGAGTDFDTKIVVKTNAAEVLALELAPKRSGRHPLDGQPLVLSGDTECYQPLEAHYELTRRCLEVCRARGVGVAIITKSALVRRDIDLLARIERDGGAMVNITVPFLDPRTARAIEPWAPTPKTRFEAMRALSEAGVEVGVSCAPLIPGLNESDLPQILEQAHAHGAKRAFMTLLRLPTSVLPVFRERMAAAFPERIHKIEHAIQEMRGGAWNDAQFGARMRGTGPRWELTRALFELTCRRLGLNDGEGRLGQPGEARAGASRSARQQQGELF